ncbi:O-antigen ligase [Lacinutrix sp. Hel_I_90]|uniref:O-antigen ligase family protein n=1 Tax=Lacinutrix sp. Hel_I_90 TaxID=1249999 RepID=UPI0005CA1DD5|nr:O-antigen ligase family protein [Lacinutrix sp. Hel_I_90]
MTAIRAKYKDYFKDVDLVFLLLIGVLCTFPLEKWNPKFILGLFIAQLFLVFKKREFRLKTTPFFWMLMALFSLNFFGLFYTENLDKGFAVITRQISLVLFPIFYASYNINRVKLLFKTYCISIFIFLVVFEAYTVYRFFYQSAIFPLDLELFLSFRYTGAELTKLIDIHNAYLGIYIIMSNILIVSFLKTTKKNYHSILLLLLIVFQSLFLMQMVAKTAIILNGLIIIPSLVYLLILQKRIKMLVFFATIVMGLGYFTITKFDLPLNRILDRVEELSNSNQKERETRPIIWKSALPLIKNNIVIGLGTGDANNVLISKYKSEGLKTNTNVHNQYLDYLLRFGVVGLLIFLGVFSYALYQSVKLNNYVYFCFLTLILGSCFTENILSRQWGVTFFATFNYLLYLTATKTIKWE